MDRFLKYFTPEHYILDLAFDRKKDVIHGEVEVSGIAKSDAIKLHAVDLQIKSALLKTEKGNYEKTNFNYEDETLNVEVPKNKEVKLKIKFESRLKYNLEGCYLSSYKYNGETKKLITTQFESHYARRVFPCIDEPAAKAEFTLNLSIPDLADEDVVLANTELKSRIDTRFEFATTPRMSTYLLAWVIGPLHSISTTNKNSVKVSTFCALNQPLDSITFANDTAARALEYYDEKYGIKYPLTKLDQVALPDFEAGAMENWGLVTYRESCLLATADATDDTKHGVAITITHELAHQWFGNLVTMSWWDDLWLNEAFATIMEYYATDTLYPEYDIWQDFFTGDCVAALRRDCLPGVQAVQQAVHHPEEISTLFDAAIVYAKGARLVLMLMRLMGEENFYRGVHDYLELHKYKNAIGDDLWNALQPYADFNVKDFMHAWISQPGYPALKKSEDSAVWSQERFLIAGSAQSETWPLPEIFDDMSGHYLINLSDEEFAVKLETFSELSLERKLRLLIDRLLLAKTPAVPAASLLDLLPKFADETSSAVWNVVLSLIGDLKLFCPPESRSAKLYQKFLRETFAEQIDSLSLKKLTNPNEIRLRDDILSIVYYVKDKVILEKLAKLYNEDFSQIDSELLTIVLSAKMYFSESEVFSTFLEMYQETANPESRSSLLSAITSAKSPENIATLISLLSQPEVIRPQDHIFFFVYLLSNPKARTDALKWFYEHWDYIINLTGEKSVEDYARCVSSRVRTDDEAKDFFAFFDEKSSPIISRTLEIARVEIPARLQLIESDSPAVLEKLKSLTK